MPHYGLKQQMHFHEKIEGVFKSRAVMLRHPVEVKALCQEKDLSPKAKPLVNV